MKASGSGRTPAEFLDRRQHVERRGVAIGILAVRQRLGLLPPLAAGDVGEELEQHVGRRAERHVVDQHVAQRAAADRMVGRCTERGDHRIGQRRIVGREQAEGVADGVVDARAGEIELDVPGFLFGARLVEARAREECRLNGIVARTSRSGGGAAAGAAEAAAAGVVDDFVVVGDELAKLLEQRLEHPGGFLAAGHAEIQPLLLS